MKKYYLFTIAISIIAFSSFAQTKGTFKDSRDGKTYKTVKIGNQTWMAENLAYKPNSGDFWAYDNKESNLNMYGYLYSGQTAQNVCPTGWRLPTSNDWEYLIKYLGGNEDAKNKLRYSSGENVGFDAYIAGSKNESNFIDMYESTSFWSSTRSSESFIYYVLYSSSYKADFSYRAWSDCDGAYVRCIKN